MKNFESFHLLKILTEIRPTAVQLPVSALSLDRFLNRCIFLVWGQGHPQQVRKAEERGFKGKRP